MPKYSGLQVTIKLQAKAREPSSAPPCNKGFNTPFKSSPATAPNCPHKGANLVIGVESQEATDSGADAPTGNLKVPDVKAERTIHCPANGNGGTQKLVAK